jgi:hypothetical protein
MNINTVSIGGRYSVTSPECVLQVNRIHGEDRSPYTSQSRPLQKVGVSRLLWNIFADFDRLFTQRQDNLHCVSISNATNTNVKA